MVKKINDQYVIYIIVSNIIKVPPTSKQLTHNKENIKNPGMKCSQASVILLTTYTNSSNQVRMSEHLHKIKTDVLFFFFHFVLYFELLQFSQNKSVSDSHRNYMSNQKHKRYILHPDRLWNRHCVIVAALGISHLLPFAVHSSPQSGLSVIYEMILLLLKFLPKYSLIILTEIKITHQN